MMHPTDQWVLHGLALLAEWSVRWGMVIAVLAAWLALRPPRKTATRHLLCLSTVVAGVLLPVAPRWGHAVVPWPRREVRADGNAPAAPAPVIAIPEDPAPRPSLASTTAGAQLLAREDLPRPEPARMAAHPDPVRPTITPADAWRLAAMAAAVAWAAVVLALLSRLVGGWLTLSRLRREAVEVDRESERLLGECRAALGLSRPVRVAVHPAVSSPAVVGGARPIVLVPTDWGDWPESHRRACLLHELAHLSRYDDWAKLAQELLRAPFFFHPAVRWLLARLDRERELLCDEAVVALGSDPVAYARLLLEMARRPARLRPVTLSVRPGWLPFLERRTVKVRIERLLEDDMLSTLSLSSSRPLAPRTFLLGGLALAAALLIGGLRIHAQSAASAPTPTPAGSAVPIKAPDESLGEYRGVVLDAGGRPVPGATIVSGTRRTGWKGHPAIATDDKGRFTWRVPPGTRVVTFLAYKEGFAVASRLADPMLATASRDIKLWLARPAGFSAVLVDGAGKPVAGATVRAEMLAQPDEHRDGAQAGFGVEYTYLTREVIGGTPIEKPFVTTTDAAGAFAFRAVAADSGLRLGISTADGRAMRLRPGSGKDLVGQNRRMMEDQGFATAPAGQTTRLVAIPAARVSGRVLTKLSGARVSGLTASYQASRTSPNYPPTSNLGAEVTTDADGRFTFDGLDEGAVNVYVQGDGENKDWTYRSAEDVKLTPGNTSEVTIELIRGVDVEGTVVAPKTNAPIEGARVSIYGPSRPLIDGMMTDARGRFHHRLPPGETSFHVMAPLNRPAAPSVKGSSRTVTIPEGASKYDVPPIELAVEVTVRGRVLDATGAPIAGATVVGTCEGGMCQPFPGTETVTDGRGEFRLPPSLYNTVAIGKPARLLIRLRGGAEHELAAVPSEDGAVTLKLPVAGEMARGAEAPRDVAPDELAGVVVDTQGKPIGGAEVDAWTWYPGNETRTNAGGLFRIGRLDKGRKVEVLIRKPGYTPQLFLMQPTGEPGWVIVLGNKTYFEGRVTAPGGKPVAGARIRANNGPKRADGVMIGELWTEATTDQEGRYRMYAQADIYDIQVRVPGVGVARRPRTSLDADEAKRLDINLTRGVTFRAEAVDSLTGDPVPGVRLWHWQHPGIEGRSRADGIVEIPDMMPGPFQFMVDAPGYARWWSEEASNEWSRRKIDETKGGWQRNFDRLDFALQPEMKPVTITVERGVTVTGRVLDPDGKPVAGATVAPALTGTGNSLTGDTRFSVETGPDGRFTTILPASGAHEYNLVAHDGKYDHWRTWANGVRPPFRTKPGEEVRDVEISLTRPTIVRGRVTDASGKPVPDREVRASAADRLENRYYDPTTTTAADGSYELKFIRPGQQFIQVAPFWLDARQAPERTSRTLTLRPGESRDRINFEVPTGGPK